MAEKIRSPGLLLAIDTATHALGIALHSGTEVVAESIWRTHGRHTIELAPEVALALRRANVEHASLTGVAVALGPGSYTGLRIGLALAKGLALVHKLAIVGIPTLDILAHAQPARDEPMLCALQAGRGRIAALWYKWDRKGGWKARKKPQTLTWAEVLERLEEPTYICGELGEEGRQALRGSSEALLAAPSLCIRRPSLLAELAWKKMRSGKPGDPAILTPMYLASTGT